jgi:hypothetical protein
MPFETILTKMLSQPGVEAVVFLDAEGETILSCGAAEEEKLKLAGAYQGILLATMKRAGMDGYQTVVTLYENRSVLTHRLKDGYFICVIFRETHFAILRLQFQKLCRSLELEL